MNEVKISGAFEKGVEITSIDRGGQPLSLCRGSLSYTIQRDDGEKVQWVDVECVGPKAFEMADIPMNVGLTITGELRRAAWKDKQTDEWQSRHFIYYRGHEMNAAYAEQAPPPADDDIPF